MAQEIKLQPNINPENKEEIQTLRQHLLKERLKFNRDAKRENIKTGKLEGINMAIDMIISNYKFPYEMDVIVDLKKLRKKVEKE